MESVAEHEMTVVLSSHLISDVERVCDHLVVLAESRVRIATSRSCCPRTTG
jgi:ABC-2 type transport system ATP-binding protein